MIKNFKVNSIGVINVNNKQFSITLDKEYIDALESLEGFSHLQIIWWAHLTDNEKNRSMKTLKKLFINGPEKMGIFATRAPVRPNPLMISTTKVLDIDYINGIIKIPFVDAEDGSPVLDIKPYYPMERVKNCSTPKWCEHWPKWQEDTAEFDWSKEINFID